MASANTNVPRYIPNLSPSKSPFPLLNNQTSSTMEMESPLPTQNELGTGRQRGSFRDTSSCTGAEAFLTWDDLWVTVPSSSGTDTRGKNNGKAILQGLNGYAQPSEILAIMGPSGSGKSTLLDALAGRLASNTKQSGLIKVNGRKSLAFGTSAYVTQDDELTTTLTVKESIYYSAMLQLPESMTNSEKKERAETTIRDMGLQEVMDTRIGGWYNKGLSGGQKRRVSICIEILTRPKLLFLDEPTSGLDSAASYHVMDRIEKLTKQCGMTVIASIHQPSSEVFDLFHKLCLLSFGRTVFFGPASAAYEFFTLNGFPCPTKRNPSDHYLRTINKDFDNVSLIQNEDTEQGLEGNNCKLLTTEEATNILVESYRLSQFSQEVKLRVSEISNKEGRILEKGSHACFLTQSIALTKRSFVNMNRDLGYYWLRLGIYISISVCLGTIFYDIGYTFDSIQDMMIFERERLNGHYGVTAFIIGNTLSSTPYLLINTLIPGAIAYYLAGLHKGFEHFLFFVLVIFVSVILVESLMMIVASMVPNYLMGIIIGSGIQGVMMLNAGFFRLPDALPNPFWKYPMYYIAFHRYAIEGLYKNEFKGLSFPRSQGEGSSTITGEEIIEKIWQMPMSYSKWIDLYILFGMVVLYRLMFFVVIKTSEKIKPILRSFSVAHYKPTKQSNHGVP
ncbi:ABC transporter G family member 11-like isoform X2 [Papaver somniferum]|uniref:ABC transporter G family member 11-like isoform X2 n=1 Tax=Papaver somniferum TaxID=3469 RepID=UPI000E70251C|nr:ABC transporter G family member 11-like isoform X2 [Papaver somniferum]